MSADEGADKTQAPKPAPTFTSFINKNTSGKKFAPKAARRRAPVPTAPTAEPPTPPTPPTEPEPARPTVAQLPTPAATQEPDVQNAPQTETGPAEPSTATAAPSVVQPTPSTATEPPPTPISTNTEAQHGSQARPSRTATPQPAVEPLDTERPAKRRRTQPPVQESTVAAPPRQQPDLHTGVPEEAHATAAEDTAQQSPALPIEEEAGIQQPRKRTRLPWAAVNHVQEGEEGAPTTTPAKRTRQPARARAKTKAAATVDTEEQEGDEEHDGQATQKRPGATARNKRRADEANADDDFEADAPAKKPRKPRKKKAAADDTVEGDAEQAANPTEEGTTTRKPRKPRQPRRRIQPTTEGENADGEHVAQPKRKGRPPREDTPPEAEHQTIDPDTTFMDSLASRNIRVGKLSNLERRMRGINWDEVKQRQREEDRRIIPTKETQAAVDKLLNAAGQDLEAANAEQGPRMRVVGDRIELIHDSGTIDREAEADMHIATMEVHEEADLTTRITTRSFMKNGKRFPNDFLLPGQGHRWTQEQTDRFYQGLRMYGTDFQMISMMFPNLSRRVVKTKFTREEREFPDKVAQCLLGELEMASGWDAFLQASELQDDHFADADEIKRQMDEVEARMRVEIEAAKAETAERKRQLKEAGLLPEGEEGAPDKDDGKGRKKRREKGKQVTFQEDDGVEILGGLDDDPNWGQ